VAYESIVNLVIDGTAGVRSELVIENLALHQLDLHNSVLLGFLSNNS
jgi:hypothetical protein